MADPRWSIETEALVLRAIALAPESLELAKDRRALMEATLAALADAGLLLPPGGENTEVFEVRTPGLRWPSFAAEAAAWEQFARVKAWPAGQEVEIYRQIRTEWPDGRVYYGPLVNIGPRGGA